MGKNKIAIQKKATKTERQTTYGKRSKGLLKKAYELSVLCGVDVALIMFSPSDVLKQFSNNPRLEKILQSFVQSLPNLPEEEREKLQISQDTINRINISAGLDDVANQQSLDAAESEEMDKEIGYFQNKLMMLQQLDKMLNPDMEAFNSAQQFEEHRRCLVEALNMIKNRKKELLSSVPIWTPYTNPSQLKVQVQKPMQQLLQAGTEAGNWGPLHRGEQFRQRVPVGNGGPSSVQPRIDASPHFTGKQKLHIQNPSSAGLRYASPQLFLQPEVNAFLPCSSVLDSTDKQEVGIPSMVSGPSGAATGRQYETRDPLHGGNVEHGMTPSGSNQPIIDPSSSLWHEVGIPFGDATWQRYETRDPLHGGNVENGMTPSGRNQPIIDPSSSLWHEVGIPFGDATWPQYETRDPLHSGDVEHGMTSSGSNQPIIDPSSSLWHEVGIPFGDATWPQYETRDPLHSGDVEHGMTSSGSNQPIIDPSSSFWHEVGIPFGDATWPQYETRDPLHSGDVEHGMTPSGSNQPIIDPSSSIWHEVGIPFGDATWQRYETRDPLHGGNVEHGMTPDDAKQLLTDLTDYQLAQDWDWDKLM